MTFNKIIALEDLLPTRPAHISELVQAEKTAKAAFKKSTMQLDKAVRDMQAACLHERVVERKGYSTDVIHQYIEGARLCLDCGVIESGNCGFGALVDPISVIDKEVWSHINFPGQRASIKRCYRCREIKFTDEQAFGRCTGRNECQLLSDRVM